MNLTKDQVRKEMIAKRKKIQKSDVIKKSQNIKKRLYNIDLFQNARTVLFYVSYDNEVDTHDMIKECLKIGKTIIVPKSLETTNELLLSKITTFHDLSMGLYGIFEPRKESIKEVDGKSIDVIIIPGVAFDQKGNRIGHGKGYYDRLLLELCDTPIIALSFEFQLIEHVPTDKHDKNVDMIITEERIIKCNR